MKRTLRFISLFTLLLLVLSVIGFVSLEKITKIECFLVEAECSPETTLILEQLQRKQFFITDFEVEIAHILQSNPEVQVDSVIRVWPSTLRISLKPSQPVYAVSTNEQSWVATKDGYLIKTQEDTTSIPQIYFSVSDMLSNDTLSQTLHDRLALLIQSLEAEKISYQEIEVQAQDRVLVILDSKIGLLSLDSPAYDSKRLSLVLKGLEPDKLDTVREIDLRYKFPVLRNESTVPRQKSQ